jgi:methylated-DNA-[protein]-cysteine S-methyltransferase
MSTGTEVFAAVLDDAADVDALRTRLAERAAAGGLLDVAVRRIDSPIGTLLLAATEDGLVRVAFEREGYDAVLQELADRVSPRVLRAPARLDAAAKEIDEYFAGARRHFDLPLDRRLAHGFRREVLVELERIPYGGTRSYAQVARSAGRPTAVRAAGSACAANPLPIVVPCHRVVRTDGSVGAYRGGSDAKRLLLALEAAA